VRIQNTQRDFVKRLDAVRARIREKIEHLCDPAGEVSLEVDATRLFFATISRRAQPPFRPARRPREPRTRPEKPGHRTVNPRPSCGNSNELAYLYAMLRNLRRLG
jgi:hypothetical protein